jgi:PDZ domain/Aspartyl protease
VEAMRGHYLLFPLLIAFAHLLPAATPVASATFTGGEQGRILIAAKINGKGPYPFIFDTGSINIISLDLANELGISVDGKQPMAAFGGSLETGSAVVDSITVGDFTTSDTVTMPHTQVAVIGGGPFTHGGPVGFLGSQFLANLVIEVDYEHGRLDFYDPATYSYSGTAVRLPVSLAGNLILVPVRIYGETAALELDSGNENSALVLFRRFVTRKRLHSNIEAVTGYGFGGLTRAMITRAPALEIGGFKVASPLTNLSLDESGVENGDLDGNTGAPILREFKWTFDIPHKSVYLEPNKWFNKPELDDHSGLVLDTRNGLTNVLFVYAKSPAANAGIQTGDELTAIDGQPLTSDQWHDLLDAAPGTVVSLRVIHEGKGRRVFLTLNTYI